jgi:hypothetical protein
MNQNQQHMLGLDPEPRTLVDNRVWFGQKLALWKSKVGWEIATKQAAEIVARCAHMTGCPAEKVETELCLRDCPDREIRMSALVVLNAARQFAPPVASKISGQLYTMPSREYFSAVVAELAACQAELETLRGTAMTMPPPSDPPQLAEKK